MENKRTSDPVLVELLQMVTETHGILKSHMHDNETNSQAIEAQLSAVIGGFPSGDPTRHREWHDSEIQRIKDRTDFWRRMTFALTKYGLAGFIGWAAYALWVAVLHGPGK